MIHPECVYGFVFKCMRVSHVAGKLNVKSNIPTRIQMKTLGYCVYYVKSVFMLRLLWNHRNNFALLEQTKEKNVRTILCCRVGYLLADGENMFDETG